MATGHEVEGDGGMAEGIGEISVGPAKIGEGRLMGDGVNACWER